MKKRPTPIIPHMVRRVPQRFSWIDQRLIREQYIDQLSHEACALYLFLVTVSDRLGLSYYGEETVCERLHMSPALLYAARTKLIECRLLAYRPPLYQILTLDNVAAPPAEPALQRGGEAMSLGQILQQLGGGAR